MAGEGEISHTSVARVETSVGTGAGGTRQGLKRLQAASLSGLDGELKPRGSGFWFQHFYNFGQDTPTLYVVFPPVELAGRIPTGEMFGLSERDHVKNPQPRPSA